ncbi:hypothetical protein BZA05DRAFT_475487 [Tricharina praecox]|uniref:uncharacterized protein n=1 Tax=Tricharina praecox TaxID=43433 RepID=UPI00221E9577|nr:uncharacterized protein BZA05DRAFT_475487 [Tricharina praecox]KAI5848013.1 hypothetical protein BZA05DRAFT_475487 [Tricharina praecox]
MPPLRPLGPLERWFAIRHTLSYHNSVSLTFTVSLLVPLTPAAVTAALTVCLSTHAVLSVRIASDTDFQRVWPVDLSHAVVYSDADSPDLPDIALEANTGFADAGVCWRMTVFARAQKVVLSYHHGIMDGEAGVAVVRCFVGALLAPPVPPVPSPSPPPPPPELPPPLEQQLALSVSWRTAASKLATLLPAWLPSWPGADLWTGPPIGLSPPFRTRIELLELDAAVTWRVRARCRREGTSVTALLHAAVAEGLVDKVGTGVSGSVAVSFRRFLPRGAGGAEGECVGVMASSLVHTHHPGGGVWERARGVKATITAGLRVGPRDCKAAMLAWAPDIRAHLLAQDGRRRELAFGVSNLGVVDIVGVEELVFNQSASPVGNALDVCAVATDGSGLRAVFGWIEGVLQEEWMKDVVVRVKDILEEAAGEV